jgi:nucleotide-binding universal stress UspA family protein
MFTKILLPVDLSDRHGRALETAAELALQGGGTITFLHVIEVITGSSMEEEKAFYSRLEKAAREHLRRLGEVLTQQRVAWQAEVLFGHRVPAVARYAREAGSDLIVLTAPQFDPENPGAGWGSLSYRISLLSPCPALLVK